jgi:3-phosphoshikimate 1-carboxyvinyltransferase
MADVRVEPIHSPFQATITPPGSKSLTNRALVLAALSEGQSDLSKVLFADDTLVMIDGLAKLGFVLEVEREQGTVHVHGRGGKIESPQAELFCANSGTTIRFLTALCTLGQGTFALDGAERMRQRPIAQLVDLLKNLGARIEYLTSEGTPPVRVIGDGLPGGLARYGAAASSQFLSAVVMVAPYARNEVRIDLDPPQTSWPYVAMTMRLMDHFGVTPELIRDPRSGEPKQIIIPRGRYRGTDHAIEPDASNASYFLAAAAVHPGSKVTIEGLGKQSLQGDVGFADLLHRMGAGLVFGKDFITITGPEKLEGIDADLSNMPDMAQTLAAVALFADGPSTLRGLHTLRVKETDRIAALKKEIEKLGAEVSMSQDTITILPPEGGDFRPATIDTYGDHRMAMSFAVVGSKVSGITIRDAQCVQKTYPRFFEDFARLNNT